MKISYIIIDDEHVAHDIIKDYCDRLPNMELQKHCYDAVEAFEHLQTNKTDLIFLDINMPKLKGFDFLKTLSNPPKVIVTTAYREFALEGYELNVSDYLLKPFSFERFLKAIGNTFGGSDITPGKTEETAAEPNRIFFRSNKKHIQLTTDTIQYIEAAGNYTKIITPDETITTREKLSDVLGLLPRANFLRVHKSFVVATKHIHSIEGNRIVIAEKVIPIGKMYKNNIMQLLKQ